MTDEPAPIDDELRRMTSNHQVARAIKDSLERLSKGTASGELAEMARELLEGRTSLREVGRSSAYAGQFTEAAERYRKWFADLSPEQREELERTTRQRIANPDVR